MSPAKRDMKSLLKDSLVAEDMATRDRFARADIALGHRETSGTEPQEASRKRAGEAAARTKSRRATQKVIRDTFSMPEGDHALIGELQEQLVREHALVLNKSEILRAGLHALRSMPGSQRMKAARSVENLKRGRKV